MNQTNTTRKPKDNRYVQLLKKARKLIESEREYFVCVALRKVEDRLLASHACFDLRQYIRGLLGGHLILDDWLLNEAKVPASELTHENMRAYRLRFIDHLIETFKNHEAEPSR